MVIEAEKLACGSCGASLAPPKGTQYITCSFCNTSLRVRHEGGAVFSEIRDQVDGLQREVAGLKVQNRILTLKTDMQQLDRWWESERVRFMVRGRTGQIIPKKIQAIAAAIIWGTLVVGTVAGAFTSHGSNILTFVGMGFVGLVLGGVQVTVRWRAAVRYENARADYFARRVQFVAAIAAAEKT